MKLITFLFFLLPLTAFSQAFSFNQGGPGEKNYYSEIPFENINGELFLTVEIAGKKHRFMFDTGAPVTISKELATQLNAKLLRKDTIYDAYTHTAAVEIVQVNGIKLGDITFNQIPAIATSPFYYECYKIEGNIGSNLLRNSIVSIDNKKHVIIFTDQKEKLHLNENVSAPLVFKDNSQSSPEIHIVLDNRANVTIPFDTGDESFLRIDSASAAQLKQAGLVNLLTKGYGASRLSFGGLQSSGSKYLYKMVPFSVGIALFRNLIFESDKDAIPAIGSKLLNYGTVTLDYLNSKFYFDAYSPVNDLTEKHWPIEPTFVNNKLVIGVVWEGAKLLLKQGEQILAMNDQDYSHITLCEFIAASSSFHNEDHVTLTVKNTRGEIRKVILSKY